MKSVGETMAIGRTFKSLSKGVAWTRVGRFGFGCDGKDLWGTDERPSDEEIRSKLSIPNSERVVFAICNQAGYTPEQLFEITYMTYGSLISFTNW